MTGSELQERLEQTLARLEDYHQNYSDAHYGADIAITTALLDVAECLPLSHLNLIHRIVEVYDRLDKFYRR